MKLRSVIVICLVFLLIFGSVVAEAYAFDLCKKEAHQLNLKDKFYLKAKLILSNQEELGLSDSQVEKIKELKINTKKDLIKIDAEIDIVALDIKAEMEADSINTDAVNKLIDKKYDLKKEKDKSLVAACAALKDILTKEQKEKMKELYKKSEKCEMGSSMMQRKMKRSMMEKMMGDKR